MAIQEGRKAPDFTLDDQDGNAVKLSGFAGKKNVLVYFYPRDDTPGCTKEACGFRDEQKAFAKLDTVVLGVSADGAESHQHPSAVLRTPDDAREAAYAALVADLRVAATAPGGATDG
jgi:peroxiredoxin Q/BCP